MRLTKKQKAEMLTTTQAAEWLGWEREVLIRMRTCSTRLNDKRGPPHIKVDEDKTTKFYYHKDSLIKWASTRPIFLTVADVARLLQVDTCEVLTLTGLKKFQMRKGEVIIYPAKKIYMYIRKGAKR